MSEEVADYTSPTREEEIEDTWGDIPAAPTAAASAPGIDWSQMETAPVAPPAPAAPAPSAAPAPRADSQMRTGGAPRIFSIFVASITPELTSPDLKKMFEAYGPVCYFDMVSWELWLVSYAMAGCSVPRLRGRSGCFKTLRIR